MKKMHLVPSIGVLIILASINGFPTNDLSIRQDVVHPQVGSGYIDDAVLVIEPYGAYAEQSLYVRYSDHGSFQGQNVLVIHSFELPQNAVVNDLWLWMGDSVMQAKIFERKQAQYIWDSVTRFNRDPAFLKQTDNQFDLNIYPLTGGSYRKIKMRFQTPLRFLGTVPYIDLPIAFFAPDSNKHTPLKILFRSPGDKWGNPQIVEALNAQTVMIIDTLGKRYREIYLADTKQYKTLTMTFNPDFSDGYYAQTFKTSANTYYSLGIHEKDFFKTPFSTVHNKKKILAFDMSGFYGVDSSMISLQIASFLQSYLAPDDSFKIIVAGAGLYDTFPQAGWNGMNDETIQNSIAFIKSGRVMAAKVQAKKPKILFLGESADMRFPGIENLADLDSVARDDYASAVSKLGSCDIAANYFMWEAGTAEYQAGVDAFLKRGGIFIGFFCFNRTNGNIAQKYFSGLPQSDYGEIHDAGMKYRKIDGVIGPGFPEKIYYEIADTLRLNDPLAIPELVDENGKPVVVSKRVGKGLFVLRGIFHMHETPGVWKELGSPLYNLQDQTRPFQLVDLLKTLLSEYRASPYNEIVLFSNSDRLITGQNIGNYITSGLLDSLSRNLKINSVNLISGDDYLPPIYTANGFQYYGSSYVLDSLAVRSGGLFQSLHNSSWSSIIMALSKDAMPGHTLFSFSAAANGTASTGQSYVSSDFGADNRFFTGITGLADSLTFTLQTKYQGFDTLFSRQISVPVGQTGSGDSSLQSWYAQYYLRDLLSATPLDTQSVITFATSNRLLCDFTAFIALEPNNTNHFLVDPKDESTIGTDQKNKNKALLSGTFRLRFIRGALPCFALLTPCNGAVEFSIFDLNGRKVLSMSRYVHANMETVFSINKGQIAQGMYIAVAKVSPQGYTSPPSDRILIERFSVK